MVSALFLLFLMHEKVMKAILTPCLSSDVSTMVFLFVQKVVTGPVCVGRQNTQTRSDPCGTAGKVTPKLCAIQQPFSAATRFCGVGCGWSTARNLVSASLCLYLSWRAPRLLGTKSPKPGSLFSGPWTGSIGDSISSCGLCMLLGFLTAWRPLGTGGRGVV